MSNASIELCGDATVGVPEWINEDFFKRILEKCESESVKIHKLMLSSGTGKTDNYSSVLFRATIHYSLHPQPAQEKLRSFVMKTEPFVEGVKKDNLNKIPLFQTEVQMYMNVLPKIEAKLREFGDETVLAPKIVCFSLKAPSYIVFEDLAVEGYSPINNGSCSLAEIKLALKKLAKIHAISFQMAQTDRHELATFDKTYFNTIDISNFPMLRDGIKLMKELISDQPDLQKYLPHFEKAELFLIPKMLDLLNAPRNGKRSGIQVLNHGDFHKKNLMVKYVDNKLAELMLLDYQVSIFGSPAIDLYYAFTMMYTPSMRMEYVDELLNHYVQNFQDTLHSVQYKGHIPTVNEFKAEMHDYRHWGLYLISSLFCLSYAIMEGIEMNEIIESEAARRELFANLKILDELRVLLPRFLSLGYFEE
ncbi:uncharacterized protein LOC105221674 [Zeugodacus cucurbitae]|uniref:uncharacterized protein LOC105221674 n=1 Tax=Zeugodacus cucurbitae TaxID=28588 RepID=UPI0005968E5A|nr:uncharacterized protein LOC105221674 [Zeugodacus cucurbitae]